MSAGPIPADDRSLGWLLRRVVVDVLVGIDETDLCVELFGLDVFAEVVDDTEIASSRNLGDQLVDDPDDLRWANDSVISKNVLSIRDRNHDPFHRASRSVAISAADASMRDIHEISKALLERADSIRSVVARKLEGIAPCSSKVRESSAPNALDRDEVSSRLFAVKACTHHGITDRRHVRVDLDPGEGWIGGSELGSKARKGLSQPTFDVRPERITSPRTAEEGGNLCGYVIESPS